MIHNQKIKLRYLNEEITAFVRMRESKNETSFKIPLESQNIELKFTWSKIWLKVEYKDTFIFFSKENEDDSYFEIRVKEQEVLKFPLKIKKIKLDQEFHIIYEFMPNNAVSLLLERIKYN